jgi:hypothetical protein
MDFMNINKRKEHIEMDVLYERGSLGVICQVHWDGYSFFCYILLLLWIEAGRGKRCLVCTLPSREWIFWEHNGVGRVFGFTSPSFDKWAGRNGAPFSPCTIAGKGEDLNERLASKVDD